MQRFVEQQNILLLQQRLAEAVGEHDREIIRALVNDAKRRLALIYANELGASRPRPSFEEPRLTPQAPTLDPKFRNLFEASSTPSLLIDPRPGLHIVDANRSYLEAAMIDINRVGGERMFDVFPDNPEDRLADGVANLFASLTTVVESGQPNSMPVQRYDIRDEYGHFVERYWQPLNTPVFDDKGKLAFILHQVVDVTAKVRNQSGGVL